MDILIEEIRGSVCVAATQGNRLQGLEIDPIAEEVRWGSIYLAKVKTIDAALDAAFLDLDGKNTGILYNSDVRTRGKDGKVTRGGATSIGKRFKAGSMVTVQAKSAYLPRSDGEYLSGENKIAHMSMDITLPGRYLIYGTMMDGNRISARIRDKKLRKTLEKMLSDMDNTRGCILRAAAANTQTEILQREGQILQGAWKDMQEHLKGKEPKLVALGPDAIQRSLSDQAGQLIDRIEVVTMEHLNQAEEWCSIFAPDLVTKITPIEMQDADQDLALFYYRDLMGQIEDLFQPYAVLEGGGNIITQSMAALTAVDVNKGADKRSLLAVNVEAAEEIARQIRLRNIGGIIVIDFLKFHGKKEETEVLRVLERAVGQDPCTVQIHGKTALGLVELTRKRRTPPLQERFEGGFGA
ncbi:MAG: ribonuclease E/G [Alphaproteobacteria bacterium]|nr:ribonuclease E/G [Alphaproteobacteria bacterium]